MKYLKWIYARSGQIFCFAVGASLIGNGSEYSDMTKMVGGGVMLATALTLRHQMLRRGDQRP